MTIAEFKAQMMSKQLDNKYIFNGPEVAVRDIYINQLIKVLGYNVKRLDDIKDMTSIRHTSKKAGSTLYLMTECPEVVKTEEVWDIIDHISVNDMIVLMYTNLDKRTKFYKHYADNVVEFEPLESLILNKYIKKNIELDDVECSRLAEVCGGDYGRCLLEIDKIHQYRNHSNQTDSQIFKEFLDIGVIYKPPTDAIFDFVDAVLDRKACKAFALMEESYNSGEATLVMISNLYMNFKALLQVQSCQSKDITGTTGLTSWQVNNVRKHLNKYSIGQIVGAIEIIREAEMGIKTGTIEEAIAVPWILTNVL